MPEVTSRNRAKVDDLSPDGYSRFFLLADTLKQVYAKEDKSITILDVGGGSEFFDQQLSKSGLKYELTVIDIIPRPANMNVTYIQGDATNMDLEDASYDVVVSTDVLEHIPEKVSRHFLMSA